MKLIDIMKRYNRCILKENAKLRSIYNTLIRECGEGGTEENECDVSEEDAKKAFFADLDECDGGKEENECDVGKKMTVDEFLGEADKENRENTDECDKCGDPECKNGEKCGLKEGDNEEIDEDDLMTAEEFFGGVSKKGDKKADECDVSEGKSDIDDMMEEALDAGKEVDEDEELIAKKEFYAVSENDGENADDVNEDDIEEDDIEEDDDAVNESLKTYREANRKLFDF